MEEMQISSWHVVIVCKRLDEILIFSTKGKDRKHTERKRDRVAES